MPSYGLLSSVFLALVPHATSFRIARRKQVAEKTSLFSVSADEASDYYYATGAASALTDEMRQHRVGGDGMYHIFYLPEGPASMRMPAGHGRRDSFSPLAPLPEAMAAGGELTGYLYPEYQLPSNFAHNLTQAAEDRWKATAAQQISSEVVRRYLSAITSIGDGVQATRNANNVKATFAAQEYFRNEFAALGFTNICYHNFSRLGVGKQANVVAFVQGTGVGTLTVGAHYDGLPSTGTAPAAEDNGSGAAALLAIAKAFMASKLRPVKSIYFVAFAAEEQGLYGSDAFAGQLSIGGGDIPAPCRAQAFGNKGDNAAITMDMAGWKSPKYSQTYLTMETRTTARAISDPLVYAGRQLFGDEILYRLNSNPFGSDHMSWLSRAMPGMLIINADDTRYPQYHKSGDSLAMIDFNLLSQVAQLAFGGMAIAGGMQV